MIKLRKLALKTIEYSKFEIVVLKNIGWYDIPIAWTRKDLREFYQNTRGKYV